MSAKSRPARFPSSERTVPCGEFEEVDSCWLRVDRNAEWQALSTLNPPLITFLNWSKSSPGCAAQAVVLGIWSRLMNHCCRRQLRKSTNSSKPFGQEMTPTFAKN